MNVSAGGEKRGHRRIQSGDRIVEPELTSGRRRESAEKEDRLGGEKRQ